MQKNQYLGQQYEDLAVQCVHMSHNGHAASLLSADSKMFIFHLVN